MKFSRPGAAALALLSLASQARVCRAQGQCSVRTCNPTTGYCNITRAPDGSGCNDDDLCTVLDFCLHGFCRGASTIKCPNLLGQCYNPGVCNSATGQCSNSTMKANGSGCDDGNACTQTDICQNGTCIGTNPVVCAAQDQCHAPGTCNPSTGQCSNPIKTADTWGCINGKPCPLPTVNLTNTTILEGFSVTISFASQLPVLAKVDWGDTRLVESGTQKSFTHTYKNDGNFTLIANYGDTLECVGHEEISVTVVNAEPLLQLKTRQSRTAPYTAVASITCIDSGDLDNQTIYVNWNDSSRNAELKVAAPTTKNCVNLVLNHTYAKVGTYNISAMVKDNSGAYSVVVWSNTNITSGRRLLRGVDNIQDKNAADELA